MPRVRSPAGTPRPWPCCRACRAPPRRPLATLTPPGRAAGNREAGQPSNRRRPRRPLQRGRAASRGTASWPLGREGRAAGAPRSAAPPPGGRRTEPQPEQVSTGHSPAGGEDKVRALQQPPPAAVLSVGPDSPPAPPRRTPGPRRPRASPAASQCVGRGSDQRSAAPPWPLPGPGEDAGSALPPGRPRGCARHPAQGLAQNKCFGAPDTDHTTPALLRLHIYVSHGNQSHKWRQIQRLSLKGDRRGRELQVAWPRMAKVQIEMRTH
nr:basic proline-rich protein-like [Pan troglodytes]